MARPQIVDLDYYQFQRALRRASDSGTRIERTDKKRWSDWVRENRIKEAAFRSFSKSMCEDLEPVIIDDDGKWRGYYLFSTAEEVVLKWERASD